MAKTTQPALGLLEMVGLTPSMAALDAAEKAGDIQVVQAEVNDLLGVSIRLTGTVSDVEAALRAAEAVAARFAGAGCVVHLIPQPDARIGVLIRAPAEYSPLLEAEVVFNPRFEPATRKRKSAGAGPGPSNADQQEHAVSEQAVYAIGLIETQGFTAVLEAIDTACKAADVEVLGKEKLGGGYVTVVLKGDVAAIKAAVDAGRVRVEGLGKLIAAHVIARPSSGVLGLLPRL